MMERRNFLTSFSALSVAAAVPALGQTPLSPLTVQMQQHLNQIIKMAKQTVPEGFMFTNVFTQIPLDGTDGQWELCIVADDQGKGLDRRTGYMWPHRSGKWQISTKREFNTKHGLAS